MDLNDIVKWNRRVSAVYAIGIWTMIGSYGYFRYSGRYDDEPVKEKEEVQEPENTNRVIYQTPHTRTVIVSRKDFVPYTTRIYNFLRSFSGEPERGDRDGDRDLDLDLDLDRDRDE